MKEEPPYRVLANVEDIIDSGLPGTIIIEFRRAFLNVQNYAHIVRLFVPKSAWQGQFQCGDRVMVTISQGKLVVEKVAEGPK